MKAYADRRESDIRDGWERMRTHAAIAISPHLKKGARLTPEKLLPLPWDKKETAPSVTMTAEQQRRRMKELAEKLGDKMIS